MIVDAKRCRYRRMAASESSLPGIGYLEKKNKRKKKMEERKEKKRKKKVESEWGD
jgi:hypothetical protein